MYSKISLATFWLVNVVVGASTQETGIGPSSGTQPAFVSVFLSSLYFFLLLEVKLSYDPVCLS